MTRTCFIATLASLLVQGSALASATEGAGRAAEKVESKSIVATVNGEPIRLAQLERRLGSIHERAGQMSRPGFDLDNLVNRMINDTLLAQEARALELHLEEPTKGRVERYIDSLAVELLEREEIADKAEPSESEVRTAFDNDYRRISFQAVTVDDEDLSRNLLERIRKGADMAQLARELSVDPYAQRGGLVDDVPWRDIRPEIRDVVFKLEPGELFGPHLTDLGWAVFRVTEYKPADASLFERAQRGLTERLRFERSQVLRERLAASVMRDHEVEVAREVVDAVTPLRSADGRLRPKLENGDAVAVKIDGSPAVLAGEYAQALMARWGSVRSEEAARAAAPIILRKLVDRHLLLAEARKRNYGNKPEIREAARDYETELLVQRYLEDVVAPEVSFERKDMLAYYEEKKSSFRMPPRLHLGQITVEKRREADEIVEQLRAGADLAWLARQHSKDRFAQKGGDRGWYVPSPGSSEFDRELLESEVGDVFTPTGSEGNWRIVKVTAREERGVYAFDEVSGNVREGVFSQKFKEVLDRYFEKLRERSKIVRNEPILDSLRVFGEAVEDAPSTGGPHGSASH